MPIFVDTNAGEDGVFAALMHSEEVTPLRKRLDVGDIWIQAPQTDTATGDDLKDDDDTAAQRPTCKAVCIERKTWADLSASVVDGRLREQKSRMVEPGVRYVYAIEGSNVECWGGAMRGVRHRCLWGAIVKMCMRDGISVFHTHSPEDTAALAAYLHKQLCEEGFAPTSRGDVVTGVQKRKRDNLTDPSAVLRAMISVIPGMSASKADSVVHQYANVGALSNATAKELAAISCGSRKLGPKMAEAIKTVFFA